MRTYGFRTEVCTTIKAQETIYKLIETHMVFTTSSAGANELK